MRASAVLLAPSHEFRSDSMCSAAAIHEAWGPVELPHLLFSLLGDLYARFEDWRDRLGNALLSVHLREATWPISVFFWNEPQWIRSAASSKESRTATQTRAWNVSNRHA